VSSGELVTRVAAALFVIGLAVFAWARWPQPERDQPASGSGLGDFLTWFDWF
jgi:hypothetical protein